jgi:hypothetical protein
MQASAVWLREATMYEGEVEGEAGLGVEAAGD